MALMRILCIAVIAVGFADAGVLRAVEPCEVDRLSGDPAGLSSFGASVGISGDYIVVGDPGDDQMASWAGAAYVFERRPGLLDWERKQKIFGSDTNFQDSFGYAVAIEGDRIVVGAPYNDPAGSDIGKAYVFRRTGNTWVQEQKLVSSGSIADDHFGTSVSIHGDIIAVGAPELGISAGYVYIFRWNGSTWVEQVALTNSQGSFGYRVCLNLDRLLVSGQDETNTAAAFVFHYNGVSWDQEAVLTGSDVTPGVSFGFGTALSLSGDYLVVGAKNDDDDGPSSGSAYIFHRVGQNWSEETKITALDAQGGDSFGASVSLLGDRLFIGAPFDDDGSAYFFARAGNQWVQQAKLLPSEAPLGQFGTQIGLDGAYAVVSTTLTHVYSVGAPCIPSSSAWGIAVFALLLLVGGTVKLRSWQTPEMCAE